MTVFQVDVQKTCDNIYWTNRYYVDSSDIQSAMTPALQIAEAERDSTFTYVTFVSCRVSVPGPENPSVYLVEPLQGGGERAATTVMPLTVCALVVLNWRAGRPDRKFYRGMLQAGDLSQTQTLTPAAVNLIESKVCAALFAIPGLVNKSGGNYNSIQCSPKVSQHQLTRGTRKRTQPIIPVS